jgi:molybdenum cofactor guanylyltransferase
VKSMQNIPVVLMAGGQGRRIGGNKASRHLGGISLLEHTVRLARSYSNDIAVAANHGFGLTLPSDIRLIIDENDEIGPISGLSSSLNYGLSKKSDYVLVMSCDTPFLPLDLMTRLHAAIGANSAAVAEYRGDLHPACSLWQVQTLKFLSAYLEQGRRSLIGFAETVGFVAVVWERQSFDPFFNINTAEDLETATRALIDIQ